MKNTFVVSYDVCDPKRLRRVFRIMKGWGIPLQYSVFQCDLSAKQLVDLKSELEDEMDLHVDQVLFINIGPTEGRAKDAIAAMGKPYTFPNNGSVIL